LVRTILYKPRSVGVEYVRQPRPGNRKGRLLNLREGTEQKYRFDFPDSDETVTTDSLSDIDEKLLTVFMKRVEELG
jgi:hypothetical protein